MPYPTENWSEMYVMATTENSYGWGTVSLLILNVIGHDYYLVNSTKNATICVFIGADGLSIEPNTSSTIVKWKVYYK